MFCRGFNGFKFYQQESVSASKGLTSEEVVSAGGDLADSLGRTIKSGRVGLSYVEANGKTLAIHRYGDDIDEVYKNGSCFKENRILKELL